MREVWLRSSGLRPRAKFRLSIGKWRAFFTSLATLAAMPTVAMAQVTTVSASKGLNSPPCVIEPYLEQDQIKADAIGADRTQKVPVILAVCNSSGINLGEADSFKVQFNPQLDAMLVTTVRLGRTRVFLLARNEEGRIYFDNVSGDLAAALNRLPTDGLRGISIDSSLFAAEGRIALLPDDLAKSAKVSSERLAKTAQASVQGYDFAEYLKHADASRPAVGELKQSGGLE